MLTPRTGVTVVSVVVGWLVVATALDAWGTTPLDIVLQTLTVLTFAIAGAVLLLNSFTGEPS